LHLNLRIITHNSPPAAIGSGLSFAEDDGSVWPKLVHPVHYLLDQSIKKERRIGEELKKETRKKDTRVPEHLK